MEFCKRSGIERMMLTEYSIFQLKIVLLLRIVLCEKLRQAEKFHHREIQDESYLPMTLQGISQQTRANALNGWISHIITAFHNWLPSEPTWNEEDARQWWLTARSSSEILNDEGQFAYLSFISNSNSRVRVCQDQSRRAKIPSNVSSMITYKFA